MKPNDGKHIFGVVKVGEKGQIVIPKAARDIFKISPGDSLLVLGDESQGIAIVKQDMLMKFANEILSAKEIKEEKDNGSNKDTKSM